MHLNVHIFSFLFPCIVNDCSQARMTGRPSHWTALPTWLWPMHGAAPVTHSTLHHLQVEQRLAAFRAVPVHADKCTCVMYEMKRLHFHPHIRPRVRKTGPTLTSTAQGTLHCRHSRTISPTPSTQSCAACENHED